MLFFFPLLFSVPCCFSATNMLGFFEQVLKRAIRSCRLQCMSLNALPCCSSACTIGIEASCIALFCFALLCHVLRMLMWGWCRKHHGNTDMNLDVSSVPPQRKQAITNNTDSSIRCFSPMQSKPWVCLWRPLKTVELLI